MQMVFMGFDEGKIGMFEGVLLLFPYFGNIITKECQNFNDECVFLSDLICLSFCCRYIYVIANISS